MVIPDAVGSLVEHTASPCLHRHLPQSSLALPCKSARSLQHGTRSHPQGYVSTRSPFLLVVGLRSQGLLPTLVPPSLDTSHTFHVRPNSCRVLPPVKSIIVVMLPQLGHQTLCKTRSWKCGGIASQRIWAAGVNGDCIGWRPLVMMCDLLH
jgi:hypothetical protein